MLMQVRVEWDIVETSTDMDQGILVICRCQQLVIEKDLYRTLWNSHIVVRQGKGAGLLP